MQMILTKLFKKHNSSFNPKNILPQVLRDMSKAVICVNSDLEVKLVNTSCEKLLKYTSQKLIGKKLGQLFENNPVNPFLYPLIREGSPYSPPDKGELEGVKELNILDANNNKIPVLISLKKIGDGPKPLIGFILTITDISETKQHYKALEEKTREIEQKKENLKKLQEELEIEKTSIEEEVKKHINSLGEEHARLLASISNLSLCFLMTDKYNNIILINKAANNIFPFMNIEKKITVEELQKSSQMNFDLNIQVEKARNEKQCITINDIQVYSKFINIFISPVILDSQQNTDAIGATIIIEDQTKQHDLLRSKEDLFNIASHELRTPLTAIYGYTALVKQIYFSNIQNEELKMIINNIGILSKKLSLSVGNFLDSSKLEQGKIELKKEQCDLFTVINESIKEMEGMALWKNLYIKFDPPASPITIVADRIRIMQVLNILISNAIKFTRGGGIYISVEKESDFVKIIIKDTGIGISDENKKLLFHKFQRSGDNVLTRQEGTGLGLHITKLLVEKMGGTIMLEKTEMNKGATFSFTIPMLNS